MVMAILFLYILLYINILNNRCIRCMHFVYSTVRAVYILYTPVFWLRKYPGADLSQAVK